MNRIRAAVTGLRDREGGMSLIEVVVAIGILGVLATASLGIYFTSTEASSLQRSREIAITVANQQLEVVTSWTLADAPGTGVSAVYKGRSKAKVQAQWATAGGIDGISSTHARWDPTAVGSSTAAIPLKYTSDFSGTTFTVNTYIGECYQPAGGGDCKALSSIPANGTALIRAIVVVTWTSSDYCTPGGCTYAATTLLDPNDDLEWVTSG